MQRSFLDGIIVTLEGAYSMIHTPKTIHVEPGSELDRLLHELDDAPVELEQHGVRYRLIRLAETSIDRPLQLADEQDIWAGYDPENVRASMHAAAGSWHDVDTEALKADLYRAREEGSRPPERP